MRRSIVLLVLLAAAPAGTEVLPQSHPAAISAPETSCGEGVNARPTLAQKLAGAWLPHCIPLGRILGSAYDIDQFRELIRLHAMQAVAAVAKTAWEDDLAEGKDFWRSRAMFFAFSDLDPATDAFTRDWLAAEPDSAFAQTARGAQLSSRGWAARGGDFIGAIAPDRVSQMIAAHRQADGLMRTALATIPDFLPAAETLINLDLARGNQGDLVQVLASAMQAHPNLATLRAGMSVLSPQWGGSQDQADLFCEEFAPMIKVTPVYDPATCKIDVAFSAPYNGGPRMVAAQEALKLNASPWLEYARERLATAPWDLPAVRYATLQRIHAYRPFGPMEAASWDQLNAEAGRDLPQEYPAAVTRQLTLQRHWSDNSPQSPAAFQALLGLMQQDQVTNQVPLPQAEILARAKVVLSAFPQDPGAWLAGAQAQYGPGPVPGLTLFEQLRTAEPWFINAMVYSGYTEATVTAAVDPKLQLINQDDYINAASDIHPEALPPRMIEVLDRDLNCPAIRQLAILTRVCLASGRIGEGCGGWEAGTATTMHLTDMVLAGHCRGDLHPESDEDLLYTPIPLDQAAPSN